MNGFVVRGVFWTRAIVQGCKLDLYIYENGMILLRLRTPTSYIPLKSYDDIFLSI